MATIIVFSSALKIRNKNTEKRRHNLNRDNSTAYTVHRECRLKEKIHLLAHPINARSRTPILLNHATIFQRHNSRNRKREWTI